jgi:hypothetical protein
MKRINILLFAVACVELTSACGSEKRIEENSQQASVSPNISATVSNPQISADVNIQKYQSSRDKVYKLLQQRIDNQTNPSKLVEVKQELRSALKDFISEINLLISLDNDPSTKGKLNELKKLFSFQDLDREVNDLQETLSVSDLGNEKGKFGDKTYKALMGKVKNIEESIPKFGKSPQPAVSNSPQPIQKTSGLSEFSWKNALLSFILSMLGSGCAMYFAFNQRKRILSEDFEDLHGKLNLEIHNLNAAIRLVKADSVKMIDQINKLSREINVSRKNSSSSVSLEEIQSTDSYKNDFSEKANINSMISVGKKSFIDDYNQDSQNFISKYDAEEVSEEERNIEGRRSGQVRTVQLIQVRRHSGLYWVFSQDGLCRLVPSSTMKFNKNQEFVISAVFDYPGFRSRYQRIRLIESAIVQPTSNGYELVHKGRIEFE